MISPRPLPRITVAAFAVLLTAGCGLGSTDTSARLADNQYVKDSFAVRQASLKAPAGSRWAKGPETGGTFAVPQSWHRVDLVDLANKAATNQGQALATRLHTDLEDIRALARDAEVMYLSPDSTAYVVARPTGSMTLPSSRSVAKAGEPSGMTLLTVSQVRTDTGPSSLMAYRKGTTLHGRILYTRTPEGVLAITVETRSDKDAAALATTILDSFHIA